MPRDRSGAHRRGVSAEEECTRYLQAKGYHILGQRVRTAGGEIDIVAVQGDTLVIVEVKARATADQGLYAITPQKQRRLAEATGALLADPGKIVGLGGALPPNIRFDAMAAVPGGPPLHLENAWRVDDGFSW